MRRITICMIDNQDLHAAFLLPAEKIGVQETEMVKTTQLLPWTEIL